MPVPIVDVPLGGRSTYRGRVRIVLGVHLKGVILVVTVPAAVAATASWIAVLQRLMQRCTVEAGALNDGFTKPTPDAIPQERFAFSKRQAPSIPPP